MVERVLSMHEAQGSIPCSSTFFFCRLTSCVLLMTVCQMNIHALKETISIKEVTGSSTIASRLFSFSLSLTSTQTKEGQKKNCLDRGSNTGPLDLQSNALPTELSKQVASIHVKYEIRTLGGVLWCIVTPPAKSPVLGEWGPHFHDHWWYSVVVSISGCDPLDPGSNPGTAILLDCLMFLVCVYIS
jgi:hypothetical protein